MYPKFNELGLTDEKVEMIKSSISNNVGHEIKVDDANVQFIICERLDGTESRGLLLKVKTSAARFHFFVNLWRRPSENGRLKLKAYLEDNGADEWQFKDGAITLSVRNRRGRGDSTRGNVFYFVPSDCYHCSSFSIENFYENREAIGRLAKGILDKINEVNYFTVDYSACRLAEEYVDETCNIVGDVFNVKVAPSVSHRALNAVSDSEPNCMNIKIGLRVDMCRRLFVLLQQQGAELVGDGVKRPSGKSMKRAIKLCKVGDVDISLKLKDAGWKLSVEIDDNAMDDRKNRFCDIFGLNDKTVVHDVALEDNVLEDSDFNAAWITELGKAYTEMIDKLTSETEPRFLYKKFDWRKKQFQTPKGCVEKIQKLESSLLFAMSHGSHELFHTNVWAWLVKKHKEFAHVFFENIDVDAITSITREQGNRDLTIWVGNVGNERAYVIENKFKSVPREEQLDKYRQALGDKFAEGLIVTLDNLPDGFESQGWSGKLQSKVVEEINALLEEGSYDSDPGMKLVGDYAKITSRLSELFSLYRTEMGNRWALALNHNEWDEIEDGDLESIRMADIFKKMNAADLESYLKNQSEWKQLSSAVDELGGFQPLRVHTDFLHKLPVLNCDIVKQDSDGNETSVGVILQGASFGRSAYSNAVRWNDDVADGPKAIYDVLRGTWFDDSDFLRPGLVSRKSSSKKAYKQYDTREYSFTYQDIGIESDRFDYLARMIFESIGREIELIKQGRLADFFGKSADENQ